MKKLYLIPALMAALLIVSCEKEPEANGEVNLSDNGVAFVFSGAKTRAGESEEPAGTKTGVLIPLGESGLSLAETVVDLNDCGPVTRGAPIYHENVLTVDGYNSIGVKTYIENGEEHLAGNAIYTADNTVGGTGGWIYAHTYPKSPWPEDKNQKMYFFLSLPNQFKGTSSGPVSDMTYDSSSGEMEFDYVSPSTAAAQQDVLFTSRTMSKSEYYSQYKTSGAPVTFYHALSGIKFRADCDNDGTTKTIITKVEFEGLYDQGHCVVDPANGIVTWNGQGFSNPDNPVKFSQGFSVPTYEEGFDADAPDNTVNYTYDKEDPDAVKKFGDSWYSKNNTNNLNDEAGSLTFWLVPQTFKSGETLRKCTLRVTFKVCTPSTPEGTEITHEITNFGEILGGANVEWKAGQLRTYTLDPKDVDVDIFDTMKRDSDGDGSYLVKENLRVTNTGNVKEYVRMLIMGNWYGWTSQKSMDNGDAPSIIVGYQTDDPNDNTMAQYWSSTDETYGQGFDESFTGGKVKASSKWRRGDGGWYYLDPLGPGTLLSAETTPLFKSYKFYDDWTPTLYVPNPETGQRVQAVGVHLVMEIVVQAIGAEDAEGNPYESCWAAWSEATNLTIGEKQGYIQQ